MLVDAGRVLQRLKQEIARKPHHGQRDLLALIARLEGECGVEEGVIERALRLYGVVLSDDLLRPLLDRIEGATPEARRVAPMDGQTEDALRPDPSQEDPHARSEHSRAGAPVAA